MAIYCVTYSEEDNWGESPTDRFSTRTAAEAQLEEARLARRFARLLRWDYSDPVELARVVDGIRHGDVYTPRERRQRQEDDAGGNGTRHVEEDTPTPTKKSSSSSGVIQADAHSRLQLVKLTLEIIAVAITVIGGLFALIWKLQ